MKYLAALDGVTVLNIVNAEEDAPESGVLVAYTDANPAYIGGDYVGGYFYPPQPYPSWTRSEGVWLSPTPRPADGYWDWDEANLSWVERSHP
jgi:hypothetical protein